MSAESALDYNSHIKPDNDRCQQGFDDAQDAIKYLMRDAAEKYDKDKAKNIPKDENNVAKDISSLVGAVVDQVFTMVPRDDVYCISFVGDVMSEIDKPLGDSFDAEWRALFLTKLEVETVSRMKSTRIRERLHPHLDKLRDYVENPEENESNVVEYLPLVREFARGMFWRLSVALFCNENKPADEANRLHIIKSADDKGDLLNFAYLIIPHIDDDIQFTVQTYVDYEVDNQENNVMNDDDNS